MKKEVVLLAFGTCVIGLSVVATLLFHEDSTEIRQHSPVKIEFSLQPNDRDKVDNHFSRVVRVSVNEETPEVTYEIDTQKYTQDTITVNEYLYQICDENFQVYMGDIRVTPLLPMAISLLETGNRADTDITFCALYPSAIIPITSLDDIDNMGVKKVIESEEYYNVLGNDFSTRDRGPLQMSPKYGAYGYGGHASEKEILSTVAIPDYVDDWWLQACGDTPGDRFSVRDSVGRLAVVCRSASEQITSQYEVESSLMACVLLDINHGFSSVYNPSYSSKRIGNWINGKKAVDYARAITSTEAYNIVKDYYFQNPDRMYIVDKEAKYLYQQMHDAGLVGPLDEYFCGTGKYSYVTYCHPIRAMYSIIALEAVYTGA